MLFAKKIKHILLLIFLASALSSCDDGCFEADQFYNKMKVIDSKPESIYGNYNNENGGQIADWQETGLVANGDYLVVAISGGWTPTGGSSYSDEKSISTLNSCRVCIKPIGAVRDTNCICGPVLDNGLLDGTPPSLVWQVPEKEQYKRNGEINDADCTPANHGDPDTCTCTNPVVNKSLLFANDDSYFSFPLSSLKKDTLPIRRQNSEDNSDNFDNCANRMGLGAFISLWPKDGSSPEIAYHLFSNRVVCPIARIQGKCIDENGVDRTKVIYTSPNAKIFLKSQYPQSPPLETDYHQIGDKIKVAIYDQYFSDNNGKYKIEFLRGVVDQSDEAGLIAGIVRTMERYLFGSSVYDAKLGNYITKTGVVEFMYKAILQDKIVGKIISISLVMYVCFFGLAFFMGLVSYEKKEVMSRLLKIGLVILFTNQKSWSMYNSFVVNFFKNGMDSIVAMISNIFESNMDPTLGSILAGQESNSANVDVGRKFIYIDNLIKDLISQATIAKIFGLLLVPGKGFFAVIYIPVIFMLIGYFIYTMLDVALKYIVNLLKISIGLALGPIFILFSLFEKTKDMFKNWLAFVASRALEIVILFAMLHPFLLIIDASFKTMLGFRVCSEVVNNGIMKYSIYKSLNVDREIFQWFEFFLKIAALIFITKSICDKAGYISGQLISIGGVNNADSNTGAGRGESGFNMASAIASGVFGIAKNAINSKPVMGLAKFGGRLALKGATKALRAEIGNSGSINDRVNNAFKFFGIRNRGPRSFMRDREIDKALNGAMQEANENGLQGKERDLFIRDEAMKTLNLFRANNKNQAALLGIDNHNILKRFDQKLIKEPMKNFVKQRAGELKARGIFGKEAREAIDKEVQGWAQQNISPEIRKQKVSEFMKKSSMQSYLKANAEMTASDATDYTKNLIAGGKPEDVKKAQDFIDKFRGNAVKNQIELERKKQDSIRDGGKVTKALKVGGNIAGKALIVPGVLVTAPIFFTAYAGAQLWNKTGGRLSGVKAPDISLEDYKSGYRSYRNSIKKENISNALGENFRGFFGRADNIVGGAKNRIMGLKIPFISNGSPERNPSKNLRKFDRKIARALAEDPNQKDLRDKGLKIPEYKDIKDRTLIKVNATDSNLTKVTKYLKKGLFPISIPAQFVYKKMHEKGVGMKAETAGKIAQNLQFKADSQDGRAKRALKAVGRFALTPFRKVFENIEKENYGAQGRELTKIRREAKIDTLRAMAQEDTKKLASDINTQVKANLTRKSGEDVQQHQERVNREYQERMQRFEGKYKKDSADNLAVILNKIEQKTKKEAKEEIDKELKKQSRDTGREKEVLKGEIKEAKYQDLKKLDNSGNKEETIFERLSKIEACRDDKNLDLKSVYTKSINDSIKTITDELQNKTLSKHEKNAKMNDLNILERALFANISEVNGKGGNDKGNKYLQSALDEVYKKSDKSYSSDLVGSSGANSQSQNLLSSASTQDNIKQSPFERQQKLIDEIYSGNKIIAEARELDSLAKGSSNLSTIMEEDEEDGSGGGGGSSKFSTPPVRASSFAPKAPAPSMPTPPTPLTRPAEDNAFAPAVPAIQISSQPVPPVLDGSSGAGVGVQRQYEDAGGTGMNLSRIRPPRASPEE